MNTTYPVMSAMNAMKRILTGLGLVLAVLCLPPVALAASSAPTTVGFSFNSVMTNNGVIPAASGNVTGSLNRHGNATQTMTINLTKLTPRTTYSLVAYLGSDTNATSVTNFTTNAKGACTLRYTAIYRAYWPVQSKLPVALNSLCGIRAMAVVNTDSQVVLLADLVGPTSLNYFINSPMTNTGLKPLAVGLIQISASTRSTSFLLTASGLNSNTVYQLIINSSVAQTNTTDRTGKLKLKALPVGAPDVLDIFMFALSDTNGAVVLTSGGLGIPCDATAPTVSFTDPANRAHFIAINHKVSATFSEVMDPSTLTTTTFNLKRGSTMVTGTVSYVGVTATFSPAIALAFSTTYLATITMGATDLAGNTLPAPFTWSFDTAGMAQTNPPTVSFVVPANADTGVATNQKISATFSVAMDPATINTTTFNLKQGSAVVTGTVIYAGVTATFSPTNQLAGNTIYTATITTGAKDLNGNSLAAAFVWSFTTSTNADTTPPTVTLTLPVNEATGVPINTKAGATFSKAMDPLTITTASFIVQYGSTIVTGAVSYSGVSAVFAPLTNLLASTVYTATVTTVATDLAGNPLASDYVWSWTTGVAPDLTAPIVISTINSNGATGVPINTKAGATFNKAMDPLTITTATFTLQQGSIMVTGLVSYSGFNAVFAPVANLSTSTLYTATITTGAKDLSGNALAANYVWSWTTSAFADTNPPLVILTNPTNTAMNVALNQTINATFNKAMDPLTVSTANFLVTGPNGVVTGTVGYVSTSQIANFTPTSNLTPNTTYTNTLTISFKDLSGNALATNYVWSFTTGSQMNSNNLSINLGTASTFAILATAATSGGADQINGDVGLHTGSSQGIPPSEINGTIHVNDSAVIAAQAALLAAYNEAVNRSSNAQTLPGDLGGLTMYPGLYVNGSSTGISGTGANAILTLDAQGDAKAGQFRQTLAIFG